MLLRPQWNRSNLGRITCLEWYEPVSAPHNVYGREMNPRPFPADVLYKFAVFGRRRLGFNRHWLSPERQARARIEERPQFPQAFQRIEAAGVPEVTVCPFVVARGEDEGILEAAESLQAFFEQSVSAWLPPVFDVACVDDPPDVFIRVDPIDHPCEPETVGTGVGHVANQGERIGIAASVAQARHKSDGQYYGRETERLTGCPAGGGSVCAPDHWRASVHLG